MKLILFGLALVLSGAVIPFLMVVGAIGNSLLLSVSSYSVSLAGVVCGLVAATRFSRPKCQP